MEIKGYVYAKVSDYTPGKLEYSFWDGVEKDGGPSKYWVKDGYIPVMPHTITFEPIDPKALIEGQVVCLLERKKKIEETFAAEVKKIDDALANLKCLEA